MAPRAGEGLGLWLHDKVYHTQFGTVRTMSETVRSARARGVPELYANRIELVPFRNVTVFDLVRNTSEHYGTFRNVSVRSLVPTVSHLDTPHPSWPAEDEP